MPIDYTYNGNSAGIGAIAANRAGQAQASRRDRERAFDELLKLAQFGEQRRQFDTSADQRQQGIDFGQQQANRNYNYQVIRDLNYAAQRNAQAQAQAQQGAVDFQRDLVKDQLDAQQGQDNLRLQAELLQHRDLAQQAVQKEQDQYQFGVKSADSVDAEFKAMLSQYRKMPLNEQGQQAVNEFASRYRRLQGQRATLRPGEWTQAAGQLLSEMEEAGIDDFAQTPPTIQGMIDQGQLWQDPDGDWWGIEYRNGQAVPRMFPKKNDATKEDTNVDTPFGRLSPDKAVSTKLDIIDRARKELIEQETISNADGGKTVKKYPTKDEIAARVREIMEIEDMTFGDKPGGSMASSKVPQFGTPQEAEQAGYVGEFKIGTKTLRRNADGSIEIAVEE